MNLREQALEESVKELGQIVNELGHGGRFSMRIWEALARARNALKMEKDHA